MDEYTIPDMPRNYSDNVIKSGNLSATSWTNDTILKNIHQLIRYDLHAHSVIPIRSWKNEIISGKYRQEMARQFDSTRYPKRQIVETKFSVLKRKFSGDLKARIFLIKMKEIAGKMIVCNIHRYLQFFILKVFYRAIFTTSYTLNIQLKICHTPSPETCFKKLIHNSKEGGKNLMLDLMPPYRIAGAASAAGAKTPKASRLFKEDYY
jgi:hypothetical protein